MKIFGFSDDDFAPLPDDVEVESTRTLSGGESWKDPETGDTYRTNSD
ncbi:hypothetical protein ABZX72_35550 [Streptomyces cyaneofuscatus]